LTRGLSSRACTVFSLNQYPFDSISWNRTGNFCVQAGFFREIVAFSGKVVKNAFSWGIQKCSDFMQAIYQQFCLDKILEIITNFLNWENVSAKTPKSKNNPQLNGFFTQNSTSRSIYQFLD